MQISNQPAIQKMICDAYSEGQRQLFGAVRKDVEAIVHQDKIFIIAGNASIMKEVSPRMSIRGRRIDPILQEMKEREYHNYMRSMLAEITGHTVLSGQPNIFIDNGLTLDIYCMDKTVHDIP
ncbi:hypothetical protein CLV36_104102 [Laceyella sediminis]|uniref:Na+-translocating membrane potential-generating system MpsC domain-containing protein n=1 Tax=Laceyella sediminis TaxID=573074 RepID=A0ABX5EQ60_9BACL|nr:hypothetical protein [Laceyella sediminis]PRZ15379.1 hypothetical protein CLV36_104102 [Laceyella sediminis]